jgi:hypothetical protein
MERREVNIRKVENGYVIRAIIIKEGKTRNVEAMINLMRTMGVYESWQEHKEEEIRRSLEKMAIVPFPEREEKEVICGSILEVSEYLKKFFESTSSEPISL